MFLYEIVAGGGKAKKEVENYKPIPMITNFTFEGSGEDSLDFEMQANYIQTKPDIVTIFETELVRINI